MYMRLYEFAEPWFEMLKDRLIDYPEGDKSGNISPLTKQPDDFIFKRAIGPKGGRRYNTPMSPESYAETKASEVQSKVNDRRGRSDGEIPSVGTALR